MKQAAKRIAVFVLGWTLILVGLVLSIPLVPGPGFIFLLAGLLVLASEYAWAHNLLESLRRRVPKFSQTEAFVKQKLRSWFGRSQRKPA